MQLVSVKGGFAASSSSARLIPLLSGIPLLVIFAARALVYLKVIKSGLSSFTHT